MTRAVCLPPLARKADSATLGDAFCARNFGRTARHRSFRARMPNISWLRPPDFAAYVSAVFGLAQPPVGGEARHLPKSAPSPLIRRYPEDIPRRRRSYPQRHRRHRDNRPNLRVSGRPSRPAIVAGVDHPVDLRGVNDCDNPGGKAAENRRRNRPSQMVWDIRRQRRRLSHLFVPVGFGGACRRFIFGAFHAALIFLRYRTLFSPPAESTSISSTQSNR